MDVDDEFPSSVNGSTETSSSRSANLQVTPADTFKILIASDIHLGVHEKDPIRSEDSFNTFEEILQTAKERDVDFILLGGDLFHDSKPSQSCYVKAISLIRENIMGDKPINMVYVSDSKEVFHNSVIEDVNYQDPNQNVSFPIFSIHGNHDDPSGFGRTSALDVLSATGQVNYFGVCTDLTRVKLMPILLRKGKTKLAIYGISHIRDERLSRLMATDAVEYERPPNFNSWFKILVLHQNRVARTGTKHIEEKWIPEFIDLVIWGHEHECLITPKRSMETDKPFYNVQPGSPVATSLCDAESVEKRIGVLNVCFKEFNLDEIKLKTVRPFIFHTEPTMNWGQIHGKKERLIALVKKFIESKLLTKARDMLTGHSKQPKMPLVRLRLELEDSHFQFNQIRFGQQHFADIVANPTDMIVFKMPFSSRAGRKDNQLIDAADLEELLDTSEMKAEALAPQYFEDELNKNKQLKVLGITGMCEAVTTFIEKDDKPAIMAMINHQIDQTFKFLKEQHDLSYDKSVIHGLIDRFKQMRSTATQEEEAETARRYLESDSRLETSTVDFDRRAFKATAQAISKSQKDRRDHDLSDDGSGDDFGPPTPAPAPKPRGRGRGRAASTASSRASSRSSLFELDDDELDDEAFGPGQTTLGKGGSKARGGNASRARGRGTRGGTSFRASGRSSNASTASNTDGNRSILNFMSRKSTAEDASGGLMFDDICASSPRKKAKIVYAEDDSD